MTATRQFKQCVNQANTLPMGKEACQKVGSQVTDDRCTHSFFVDWTALYPKEKPRGER